MPYVAIYLPMWDGKKPSPLGEHFSIWECKRNNGIRLRINGVIY